MSGNTMRGTPNRGQGRGGIPFTGSPATGASSIPRPVLENHGSNLGSEAGASGVSASRQKQSKRDEVRTTDEQPKQPRQQPAAADGSSKQPEAARRWDRPRTVTPRRAR
jgi:hypothetical protein